MDKTLFLSCRMDLLIDHFLNHMGGASLEARTVFIPQGPMKQWLLLEIAKRKGIAMGLKIVEVDRFSPSYLELFCAIYHGLRELRHPELQGYLEGKEKRLIDLTEELIPLVFQYGQFGIAQGAGWQESLLQKLFVEGPWKMAVQTLPELTPGPAILFGIDFLPPVYWDYFARSPSLQVYLFSPCAEYWEDICSDRERMRLGNYWKKRGGSTAAREQLDRYLRQAPRNLANWGKLGRETLKQLDRFEFEVEEVYTQKEPGSLLQQMQADFLFFQEPPKYSVDSSIRVFKTGSSRLKEIECLRDEILRLEVPFHEISVLAPNLEPYVPLIQFVFGEQIPCRIEGIEVLSQSSFWQGLQRLACLTQDRWEMEEILALFETPAFYRKQGWDEEKLQTFRSWISWAQIKWGRDGAHRDAILENTLGKKGEQDWSSWEKGLDRLLHTLIYWSPFQVQAEGFEELLRVVLALKKSIFVGEKTLTEWAEYLRGLATEFLMAHFDEEADQAALLSFRELMENLRNYPDESFFPFSVVQRLLRRPSRGTLHASSLHAIRFSSLEEGSLIPAKAIFLIGMDEESFPRLKSPSSLDLLKGKILGKAEKDRYAFLQALFSATDWLRISYGHLSADEGKPVGPSLVVQELLTYLGEEVVTVYPTRESEGKKAHAFWDMKVHSELPEGNWVVSVGDLRQLARHAWKFFLQKSGGVYLKGQIDSSFALQKGQWLRASLEKPLETVWNEAPEGAIGEALRLEASEKAADWKEQLAAWEIHPISLIFQESCREKRKEGRALICPPIELVWERVKVQIVGEIPLASSQGLISTYDDQIGGLLKVWPEALLVALALNAPHVWMLKSGKVKNLTDPEAALRSWMEYYFSCLVAPSPLLPDWADGLLRKGVLDLEKGPSFEDPVFDWVMSRHQMQTAEEIMQHWGPYLREKFKELTALYPTRGKVSAAI